jgi:hypothetical protein
MPEPLLTLEEAAALLGYTPSGLRKIVNRTREGRQGATIRFFQVGKGPIKFRPEWIDDFVAANSFMPAPKRVIAKPKHLQRPN